MAIRAVIFDLGGVLLRVETGEHRRQWEARLGLPERGLAALIFESEVGRRAAIGAAQPDDVWQFVGQRLSLSAADLAALQADFHQDGVWDLNLLAYVRALRPRYKTGILSDAWLDARDFTAPYLTSDTFDEVMFSAEEGMQKPALEFYQRILDRLDTAPQEAVFIDDKPRNIDAASRIGMTGLLFTGSQAVRDALTDLLHNAAPG